MTRFALMSLALPLVTATVAGAEDLMETVPVEPGGTLRINLDRGRIQVRSHDEDNVRIEARARGLSAVFGGFELTRDGNDVTLTGQHNRSFLFVPWGPRVTVEAWVPREYAVVVNTEGGGIDLEDISGRAVAKTSGGQIRIDTVRGPVSAETSGGAIHVANLIGSAVVQTSGGRVDIVDVEGNVEAQTSGGAMEIAHVGGRIEAVTSGGAISASFRTEPSGVLKTSGGRIEVAFPADAGVDLDAETSGGSVSVELPVLTQGKSDRNHVVGKINGGGALLQLRTSGGNISVRAI